jgi:hypothetical protein
MNVTNPVPKIDRFLKVIKSAELTEKPVNEYNKGFINHNRKKANTIEIIMKRIVSIRNCIIS